MGVFFHDYLEGPWEQVRNYLKDELEQIRISIQNIQSSTTSSSSGSFDIGGDPTPATRYVANTGVANAPTWDKVNLSNGVQGVLGTSSLPASGVSAATYGDSTHVPQITVDAKGRITAASDVTIAGAGPAGLVYISNAVISSSTANVDFVISNAYSIYQVEFINIVPVTNTTTVVMQVSTNAGSTWQTTNYKYATNLVGAQTYGPAVFADNAASYIFISGTNHNSVTQGSCGTSKLYGFSTAAAAKSVITEAVCFAQDNNYYRHSVGGWWVGAGVVNKIRFMISSGNIASGEFRLYGYN